MGDLPIASYLVVTEDELTKPPTIRYLTPVLKLNQPISFEVRVPMVSNSILKINFGDNTSKVYQTFSNKLGEASTIHTFTVDHTFTKQDSNKNPKGQDFQVTATMANHISIVSTNLSLFFEASLSLFKLSATSGVEDVGMPVTFQISPSDTTTGQIFLKEVKFIFDSSKPSEYRVITDYLFDSSNSFSLSLNYSYPNHGLYLAIVNCSNTINSQLLQVYIKVGKNLKQASSYLMNTYVNINEPVGVYVKVDGGNGYSIVANFGDGNQMMIPFMYLNSKGQLGKSAVDGFVAPNAKFDSNGILVQYAYQLPGNYPLTVNVSNPFGSIILTFCQIISVTQLRSPQRSPCAFYADNIVFKLNNNTVLTSGMSFSLARGLNNVFNVSFANCNSPDDYYLQWTLNSIILNKDFEMEESLPKLVAFLFVF